MKKTYVLLLTATILAFSACSGTAKKQAENTTTQGIEKAEKFGWRLAIQSYTFHRFTVVEALEKTQELGVKQIEIYPGHKLGGDWGDKAFGFDMTTEERTWAKELAAAKGIKIVGTGVFTTDKADDWAKLFAFAKDMGMEYISCEPNVEHWDIVDKLSAESGIKVSVHNHPQPSAYWNPDLLLAQISGRGKNIGTASDVGHWSREGLNEVECLKKMNGRVISLHFKDILPKPADGGWQEDTIWGKGVLDIEGMLTELKRQNFNGVFAIEYEFNWDNSVPDIKECIAYYNELTNKLF